MPVTIAHLGRTEDAVIEEVRDAGRTLVAGGRAFMLRRVTGEGVGEGEPYYGLGLAPGT